jgi:hypothetical protein
MNHFLKTLLLGNLLFLLAACSGDPLDKLANSPDKAIQKTLTREWQRIKRYNCKNELISDKWETVVSPRQLVSIYPNQTKNFHMLGLRNLSYENSLVGTSGFDFWIDAEKGFFSVWVKPGLNEVHYDFQYCDAKVIGPDGKPTADCSHQPYVLESGSIFMNVTYNQVERTEIGEYRPSAEECKPK